MLSIEPSPWIRRELFPLVMGVETGGYQTRARLSQPRLAARQDTATTVRGGVSVTGGQRAPQCRTHRQVVARNRCSSPLERGRAQIELPQGGGLGG